MIHKNAWNVMLNSEKELKRTNDPQKDIKQNIHITNKMNILMYIKKTSK